MNNLTKLSEEIKDIQVVDDIDISSIKNITNLIPSDGVYDINVIEKRVGQFIFASLRCQQLIANLEFLCAKSEVESDREEREAFNRATVEGVKTAAEKKIFAQGDDKFIQSRLKTIKIKAYITYVSGVKSSLDKAHFHCKEILKRQISDEKYGHDEAKFPVSPTETDW